MPAYNFQKQFVPMILDGTKTHTIRKRRKHPTKVGDILWLYTGMRTKECKLTAVAPCVRVEPIVIWPFGTMIEINNELYRVGGRAREIALADGFEGTASFYEFFQRYKRDRLDDFEIIWWNPKELLDVYDKSRQVAKDVARVVKYLYWDAPKTMLIDDPFESREGAEDEFNTKIEAITDWELWRKR